VRPCVCLTGLQATGVAARDEGSYGTSDPMLWVYEGQGNMDTVQKTAEVDNNLNPAWPEEFCVSVPEQPNLHRDDRRTCFDIRDDYDPAFPPDQPPLLHFGCILLDEPWSSEQVTLKLTSGATLAFTLRPTALAPLPLPPAPPLPPPLPPVSPPPPCNSVFCSEFESWVEDGNSKFHGMFGPAWDLKSPGEGGCWDAKGGQRWFDAILAGENCDRNWMQGSPIAPGPDDRPPFTKPASALLGFDETILGYCSHLVGLDFDGGDLNTELAERCVWANKNVLRLLAGEPWDMCQNLEWQMCAIHGRLPGQDGSKMSFATAPNELNLMWWNDHDTHPTYSPVYGGFSLGDVFFAEVAVTFTLCTNRGHLFELEVGEIFECQFDQAGWVHLTRKLQGLD